MRIFAIQYRGIEQLVARRAHNPEAGGSSPPPATKDAVTYCKTIGYGISQKRPCAEFVPRLNADLESGVTSPSKKMSVQKQVSLRQVVEYRPARLAAGKRWQVEFYATDPDTGAFRRKRVAVPMIKPARARRSYAAEMCEKINEQLRSGWNPWMQLADPRKYILWDEVCENYCRYIARMVHDKLLSVKTYNGYISFLTTFRKWNADRRKPVSYIYQLKSEVMSDFLDWLWLDKGKSARTRDNYLMWLRTFARFLRERGYADDDPTSSFAMIQGKRKCEKNRTVIPKDVMLRIKEYCEKNDRNFLLACYIEYYCFIRPKEMSHIRIRDISVKMGTISVSAEVSKNRRAGVVTIPDCVMRLMLDLGVLACRSDWYLFSKGFRPGPEYHAAKHFGDFWTLKMKKALKLPPEYKFYSLKDTGITDLIRDKTDLLSVRDQARHHSLQMTDLYTPLETREANEVIRHHESYF